MRTRPIARKRSWKGTLAHLLVVLVALCAFAADALADDAARMRDQHKQYNQQMVQLREDPMTANFRGELDQVDKWLQEALVQVGKEEFKAVEALFRRAEVQLAYVEASSVLVAATAEADGLETQLGEMKARANELKTELEALEKKEADLKAKLQN